MRVASRTVAGVAIGAIFLLPAVCAGATYWSAPINVNPQGRYDVAPHLAVTPEGTAWVVWGVRAMYSRWNGDAWEPAAPLGVEEDRVSNLYPEIACAGDGSLWVIWDSVKRLSVNYDESRGLVSHWTGTEWSHPDTLWVKEGQTSRFQIAAVSSDELWAVRPVSNSGESVEAIHLLKGNRTAYLLGDPVLADWDPSIAVDPDGVVWAVWAQATPDPISSSRHIVSARFVNGAWEPYQLVGQPALLQELYVVVGQDNTKWIISHEIQAVFPYENKILARRWDGAIWSPPARISEPIATTDTTQSMLQVTSNCGGNPAAVWIRHNIFDVSHIDIKVSRWDGTQWTWPETVGRPVDSDYTLRPAIAATEAITWVAYEKFVAPSFVENIFTTRTTPAPSLEGLAEFTATPLRSGARLSWTLPADLHLRGLRLHRASGAYGSGQMLPPPGSSLVAEIPEARSRNGATVDHLRGAPGVYSYWLEAIAAEGPSAWLGPRSIEVAASTLVGAAAASESPPLHFQWLQAVYPTPARSRLAVLARAPQEGSSIVELFSLTGRLVQTTRFDGLSFDVHTLDIDVAALPSGVYYLRYRNPSSTITRKWGRPIVIVR